MGNLVAIVGRPNVGKSTIFNRLTSTRRAIVNEEAGTTRDRQYGKVEWCGNEFSVIDTGGWVVNSDDIFEDEINKQVSIAIEEADVLLFVVDAMTGVTDLDDKVASILRRTTKPVIVVANKIDVLQDMSKLEKLKEVCDKDGVEIIEISAVANKNLDVLVNRVANELKNIPVKDNPQSEEKEVKEEKKYQTNHSYRLPPLSLLNPPKIPLYSAVKG